MQEGHAWPKENDSLAIAASYVVEDAGYDATADKAS